VGLPVGPGHGTDDGATPGGDEGDRDPLSAGQQSDKGKILDELCATTGWHRNHARKALTAAVRPKLVPAARRPRTPLYGAEVLAALRFCWAVLGAPTGKRLAPVMAELVPTLRRFGELDIDDELAALLVAMSPTTMDRRLAPARAAMTLRGRSHTKPGSLLKSQIPPAGPAHRADRCRRRQTSRPSPPGPRTWPTPREPRPYRATAARPAWPGAGPAHAAPA